MSSFCKEFYNLNFSGVGADGTCAIDDEHEHMLHDHLFSQSSIATYSLSRENNAIKVPKEAPLELLESLVCGIHTGAGAVINSLKVKAGSSFAAFGSGGG